MAKHKHYRKKAVIAGSQVEYREYEHPVIYGFEGKQGGRKAGVCGNSQRSEEYRKRTTSKGRLTLIRLINTNFTASHSGGDNYKFITLTFRDGSIPDVTNVRNAYGELKKYTRKLREIGKKQGRTIKYITVVEFQDGADRGAVHFHMIADIPVIPVTREVAEQWKREGKLPEDYQVKMNHYDMWGHGSVTVKAIREGYERRESRTVIETADIGSYVAGYMVKDFGDPRLQGSKAYSPSQGLDKPEVVYDQQAEQAVEGLGKEKVVREGCYPDTYHQTTVRYVSFNKQKK